MAESEEHEFDEGLRRIAEGQGVEPPPALWNGIRIAALERQLIRYHSAALWFKGIIGVLTVLLGVTGLLLYKASNEPNNQVAKAVVPAKADTVYVTRTEQVFTDRPVVVYVEKQSANNQSENLTANPNLDDKTNTLISSRQNSQFAKGQSGNLSQIDAGEKPAMNGKNQMISAENLAATKSDNSTLENSKTNAELNSLPEEGNGKSPIRQKSTEKSSTTSFTENSGERSKVSSLENKNAAGEEALFENSHENSQENRLVLDVTRLKRLTQKTRHTFRLPKIMYQNPLQVQAAVPPPKVAKIRTPLPERLSLSAYVSPDWNKLDVRRDEPDAFKYGDEELQAGILAGVRVGLKLSDKWSLLAGAEFSGSSFDDGKRRQVLAAERVNGQTGFPYRTALGTVVIPAELLSSPPVANDRIGLEVHEPILRYALNLPLALRYDIWRKRFSLLNQVPLRFAAYGLLGGYAQIPLRQEGKVKIFEASGREFEAELTGFQNLRPANGLSLGAGAELGVGKHLSIFIEPTYTQGLSSVVKDMPIRTTIRGFGVKLGAKWGFGKK